MSSRSTPSSGRQNSPPFLEQEESDHAIPVWLLAIGRMGEAPTQPLLASMQQEAERLLHHVFHYPDTPVRLAACSWRSLLAALIEERRHIDPQADMGLDLVMADLMEVLEFYGIRNTHWLQDLLQLDVMTRRTVDQRCLETLATWA